MGREEEKEGRINVEGTQLTSLWPVTVLSNFPSNAPQILTVLSAAELASHWPSGLNSTEDTAFMCPTRVNLSP